jgi:hypothetical protein
MKKLIKNLENGINCFEELYFYILMGSFFFWGLVLVIIDEIITIPPKSFICCSLVVICAVLSILTPGFISSWFVNKNQKE